MFSTVGALFAADSVSRAEYNKEQEDIHSLQLTLGLYVAIFALRFLQLAS